MAAYRCELCGGAYLRVSEKQIGDAAYLILKCEKCSHQVARLK